MKCDKITTRRARVMKGKCGICGQMIMPGEAYDTMGGSITTAISRQAPQPMRSY